MKGQLHLQWRSFSKIILFQSVLVLLLVTGFGVAARMYFKKQYLASVSRSMQDLLKTIERQLPSLDQINDDWCNKLAQNTMFRLSIISSTEGHFHCDSFYDSSKSTPILDRPEIQAAIKKNAYGSAIRHSKTLGDEAFYATQLIENRKLILRAGIPLSALNQTLNDFDQGLVTFMLVLEVLLVLALFWSGRKLLFPLATRVVEQTSQNIREDFVANVSHELKTPLTSIKGFADTLADDLEHGRPAEKDFVKIIAHESTRLLSMINDILDLSAMDQDAVELQKEHVFTKNITSRALINLKAVYGHKNQDIRTNFLVDSVYADHDRLLQILLNVVGNAMKFSPEQALIEIIWLEENGRTILEIKDSGPGLSKEEQAHLFERFYRGGNKTAGVHPGHGLGLSIVKHLVRLHDAEIEVRGQKGEGSQFIISFPPPNPKHLPRGPA